MRLPQVIVFVGLALVLGVPFLLRPPGEAAGAGVLPTLVVVTPHVPQIRAEFEAAFDRWHRREHGTGVQIDWRVPGGTSEIVKQLESQYVAAAKANRFDFADPANPRAAPGTIAFDLMFGGGSFDHGRVKKGVTLRRTMVTLSGQSQSEVRLPMSEPAGFSQAQLDEWFGVNAVGAQLLYDPDQYWIGTALSGFGIVFNTDSLERLGLPEPTTFTDLTDPRYRGELVLADPRQSGSVTTTFDSILNWHLYSRALKDGYADELDKALRDTARPWESVILASHRESVETAFAAGWRELRELAANARSFTNSSTKPPIDVSAGEAAAGLAIDFYGRGQAQAVLAPGQDPSDARVGYVDPKGSVSIDADPISILRGGPSPALARRFVEFCLSDEGQALWQFRSAASLASSSSGGAANRNPPGPDGHPLGPEREELRRMPVRRSMYDRYSTFMIDPINPFELASPTLPAGWRGAIAPMMGAFAIDVHAEIGAAWGALLNARADPTFPAPALAEMERMFYAFPPTPTQAGELDFNATNLGAIRAEWARPGRRDTLQITYTRWFRNAYVRVAEVGASRGVEGLSSR